MCEDGSRPHALQVWAPLLVLLAPPGLRGCWEQVLLGLCFSLSPVIGHLPAVALSCLRKLKEGQEDVCFGANTKASAFC